MWYRSSSGSGSWKSAAFEVLGEQVVAQLVLSAGASDDSAGASDEQDEQDDEQSPRAQSGRKSGEAAQGADRKLRAPLVLMGIEIIGGSA